MLTLITALGCGARAQGFPSRPLKLIVPFPVSGPTDIVGTTRASKLFKLVSSQAPPGVTDVVARSIAQAIPGMLGQPVAIERIPRGNSVNGTIAGARAAPDGHTLLFGGNVAMVINPHVKIRLPYDVLNDFAPVSRVAIMPFAVLARPGLPVNNVVELIAYAKARPGLVNYGSSGDGSTGHLAGALFRQAVGVNMVHVAFNGGVNALSGLQTGQVELALCALPLVLPHALESKLSILALTGPRRFPSLPALPTIAESGVPGFDAQGWYGLFVPARTPRHAVETLNAAVTNALTQTDIQSLFVSHGVEAAPTSPEQFATQIRAELEQWGRVIRGGLAAGE